MGAIFLFVFLVFFLHVLGKEDNIKKILCQILLSSNFMRNGWLKALSQLNSHLQQAVQQQEEGCVSGIEHEVYYICIILTSYIKDHEILALLENIPLKFWSSVSRISAIVVNLLDTIINWTELFSLFLILDWDFRECRWYLIFISLALYTI